MVSDLSRVKLGITLCYNVSC